MGYLTPEQFSTAAAEVIFMAFLPHHSEEQMRASTYGRDAHSAVVSAARTGKPDAQVEPSGFLTLESRKKKLACNLKKLINPKKKKCSQTLKCQYVKKKRKLSRIPPRLEWLLSWISLNRDETEMSKFNLREGH